MSTPEKFVAYMAQNCTAAQVAKVREKMEDGWRPFKVCGTVSEPLVLMSKVNGIRSNVAPAADHCRVYKGGEVVRYTPRGR